MDRLATLTDAADYIKELVLTIRNYHDEIEALEEEDCNEVKATEEGSVLVRDCTDKKDGNDKTQIVVRETHEVSKIYFSLFISSFDEGIVAITCRWELK